MQNAKGKGRAGDAMVDSPAVEIIFSLLKSQLCQRSTSHLLLALSLLELVLTAAKPQPQAPAPAPAARELPAVPEEGEPAQADALAGPSSAQDTDMPMQGSSCLSFPCCITARFHCLSARNRCSKGAQFWGGLVVRKACQHSALI